MDRGRKASELVMEIEVQVGNKRIAFAHKEIKVFIQFKDGPLEAHDTIMTKRDGVFIVAKPSLENRRSASCLVFLFPGDKEYRPSETRSQIR